MIKSHRNFSISIISVYFFFTAALLLLLLLDEDNTVVAPGGDKEGKGKGKVVKFFSGILGSKSKSGKEKDEKENPSVHQPTAHQPSTHHQKDEEEYSNWGHGFDPNWGHGFDSNWNHGFDYNQQEEGAKSSQSNSPKDKVVESDYRVPDEWAHKAGDEFFYSPVVANPKFWKNHDKYMDTYRAAQEMKDKNESGGGSSKTKK